MHRRLLAWLAVLSLAVIVQAADAPPHFFNDDPLARAPERQDASGAKPSGIELFYEYSFNLFVNSRRKPSDTRAGNVNTIDEVPDSSWFTNRVGTVPISMEELARGPNVGRPPAPEKWVILREKSSGTNPGFTARDANGETWFLQFDVPERPEGSSGAVSIATRLFWALGYNQVETFITTFDPNRAEIDPKAAILRPSGKRTPATRDDINEVLERAARNADGTYRVAAGRLLDGKILGPFRYDGTRSDDPNDLVPHEHRRELRALRVFGAWTNLVDWKAGNTLDTLIMAGGRSLVKHYLQDVGSSLGMANNPGEWDMGWEYFYDGPPSKRRFQTFGFDRSAWQEAQYTFYPSVGLFEGDTFDPTTWKPQTPTRAFVELREDDAFWAARRVAAFTDEMIRTAVHAGAYSNPAAEQYIASVLMKRRDKISRAYLTAVNPVVNPRLDPDGTLGFENAAVAAGAADAPREYRASWFRFDNATGAVQPIGETRGTGTRVPSPPNLPSSAGTFVAVDLTADGAPYPSWSRPARAYFRRTVDGWKLVGLDRMGAQRRS
jgi:hypothetical protein